MNFKSLSIEEQNDLFDAYLEGRIDPSVEASFEQALATDKELSLELKAHYLVRQLLIETEAENVVARLRGETVITTPVLEPKQQLFQRKLWTWLPLAASLAAIVVVLWWFNLPKPTSNVVLSKPKTFPVLLVDSSGTIGFAPSTKESIQTMKDSIAIDKITVVVITDSKQGTPQYDLKTTDTLRLSASYPIALQAIHAHHVDAAEYWLTIEGKIYHIERGKIDVLTESKR